MTTWTQANLQYPGKPTMQSTPHVYAMTPVIATSQCEVVMWIEKNLLIFFRERYCVFFLLLHDRSTRVDIYFGLSFGSSLESGTLVNRRQSPFVI